MWTSKLRDGIIVSEIHKYTVSFFFDDKSLKVSLLNYYIIVSFSFFKLKISLKLEKISIFILQFDLGNPRPN